MIGSIVVTVGQKIAMKKIRSCAKSSMVRLFNDTDDFRDYPKYNMKKVRDLMILMFEKTQ